MDSRAIAFSSTTNSDDDGTSNRQYQNAGFEYLSHGVYFVAVDTGDGTIVEQVD